MNFLNKIFSGEESKSKKSEPLSETKKEGKFEYLRADIKPIMACVGAPKDFKDYPGPTVAFDDPHNVEGTHNAHYADYYADPKELNKKGFKNSGEQTYVISVIDKQDKFSKRFKNCTGLLVAGQDKKTGDNISFLSHEDPDYFLWTEENKQKFIADLRQQLEEIKERCADGTIDARVVGGNYFKGRYYRGVEDSKRYLESIRLLSSETSKIFGFEPIVVTGPKTTLGQDDVFYDNEHRMLYITRPVVGDETTKSFVLKDMKKQEKKWLK